MRRIAIALCLLVAILIWRAQLFTVSRPGEVPLPLVTSVRAKPDTESTLDVVLPQIPGGMRRLRAGSGPLLVHYWAPWERNSRAQALALDSLTRRPELASLQVVVVCFDPFPSVARYAARNRLRLCIVLDHHRALAPDLPCPSVPFTYVLDGLGRVRVAQPGEVDWFSATTLETLRDLLAPATDSSAGPVRATLPFPI